MTFEGLAVGAQFVDAEPGADACAYQKKSKTSAYDLKGGEDGKLVIISKSCISNFSKNNPVIELEIDLPF